MRNRICIALALLTLATTGCTTALKQAYYGVRGAEGKFYELTVVDPDVLATYKAIRVEPFTNELGEHVSEKVVNAINEQAPKTISQANIFYPDGKTLVVNGKIIHFTGQSGVEGSVGSVIGGGEVCVCRVQLTDADSGDLVGEAICWGIVKSAVRRGSEEMGVGVGKGLAEWFEERLPEEDLNTRQEELSEDKEAVEDEEAEEEEPDEPDEAEEHEEDDTSEDPDEDVAEEEPQTQPAE